MIPPTRTLSGSTMTLQRQEANAIATQPHFQPRMALIVLGLLAGLGVTVALGSLALAQTTERVITNRYSGLAIGGYDVLAYFIDARPELGLPDFEAAQGGAVWRFRNEGNRASFVAHPEIYGPQFGGYDPVDLRSEEHTSELQSHVNLVCRLLLEKKKIQTYY